MNGDNQQILREIVLNPAIHGKELESIFGLSRRQLGYRIQKINLWLEQEGDPKLERTSQGNFIVSSEIMTLFKRDVSEQQMLNGNNVIFSIETRRYYLMLMLFSKENAMSLNHFSIDLQVSKNTVIHDINHVKEQLENHGLSLKYSRKHGYEIVGDEFEVRRFFIKLIDQRLNHDITKSEVLKALNLTFEDIAYQKDKIKQVEQFLKSRFIDKSLSSLPYVLCVIRRRIQSGHVINPLNINYQYLRDTKEYQATEIMTQHEPDLPEAEKLYLTLHLLSTSVQWTDLQESDNISNLTTAIAQMIHHFEQITFINIEDKEKLSQQLLLHLTPAFYRIKYNLTDRDELIDPLQGNYKTLFHMVKQSCQSLTEYFGKSLPDNEIAYLTMLFGGSLRRQDENFDGKIKAIIVCTQGTSVSQMMLYELRNLFPEIIFLDAISLRTFENYALDYDIIFSPMFILTHKKLFITKVALSENEQRKLRKEVMKYINKESADIEKEINKLMALIERTTTVNDITELRDGIEDFVANYNSISTINGSIVTQSKTLDLVDLIPARHIVRAHRVYNIDEAITKASDILVRNHLIDEQYIHEMQQAFDDSYMVIMQNIAIPHAYSEHHVHKTAMSMLVLQEPLYMSDGTSIHIIVPIAAVDKVTHLRALLQLRDLAQNQDAINQIIRSRKNYDVNQILNTFSNKETRGNGWDTD
ncbi:BglG family transcription antiterminator [Staphylococcus argenteus]|uniref:BglG family transcription antiterminator n=1 Tax=Staphylococcus argenteus TaxID=985002 RepID=UPI0005068505|nr:BglG family transcription antiterminator [Staphylococcus argenteus]MDT3004637.1 BglG family transcription antiterminator [Staphylococcus argenteus]UPO21047.1 BglG family transcription antiterminator [Staphylococcus argenteus]CDR64599.1 PTS system mannitol (Cryptic)-specific transporter subunit IIA [Staphylococcus argenteus]HDY9492582.1 transcription antiterminator [Staphylococcus argenteus]HDY9498723.1 transcription antiterminator [Staphylococcus argenteus]